jgi:hypothetical protein
MPSIEGHFTLDDEGNPVPCFDVLEWAKLLDNIEDRRVGLTTFSDKSKISTVFLGLDHSVTRHRPLLFETMVEGASMDVQDRYATWAEAKEGHAKFVEEYLLENPGVRVKKTDLRDRPRRAERRSTWERLRFEDKDGL